MTGHFRRIDTEEPNAFITTAYRVAVSHGATCYDAAIAGAYNARICGHANADDCPDGGSNG